MWPVSLQMMALQFLDEGHYPLQTNHSVLFTQWFSLNPYFFVVSETIRNFQEQEYIKPQPLFSSHHTLTKSYSQSLFLLSQSTAQEPPMAPQCPQD